MDWSGKVVFITGASSGIGAGLALNLAGRGASIGLIARRSDLLLDLAAECRARGGQAVTFPVDVTDARALADAAESARREFGKIDILFANAGTGGNEPGTRAFEANRVKTVIDTNLLGAVNAVAAVLPNMLERHSGHLVAVSSLAAYRGLPGSAAYCASKAGMTAYFESVRLDVRARGVDVTIVHPGFIKAPRTAGRSNNLPFLMELDDAVAHLIQAVERKKKFAAFPWQLAAIVGLAKILPAGIYDRVAGRARYRD
jgi:NADP-dependent 3-hydroxy acid dehydrogenase YdfG